MTSSSRKIVVDGVELSSPQLAHYTQSGSLPFVHWNFVRKHRDSILAQEPDGPGIGVVKLNMGDFVDYLKKKSTSNQPVLTSQPYFADLPLILTQFDPLQSSGTILKSTNEEVPVLSMHGKKMITPRQAVDLAETLGVGSVQAIGDIQTPDYAKRKWTSKSVARSGQFLEDTLRMIKDGEDESSGGKRKSRDELMKVWATVTGGVVEESRLTSCKKIREHEDQLVGVIIEGFFGFVDRDKVSQEGDGKVDQCKDDDDSDMKKMKKCDSVVSKRSCQPEEWCDRLTESVGLILVNTILPNLPPCLPRALWGVLMPADMIRAVHAGIDLLDSSICAELTSRYLALPYPLIDSNSLRLNSAELLDLTREDLTKAWGALSPSCECHACANGFTRGYLHHLLKRKEVNGSILLQMHNLFALTSMFVQLRRISRLGQLEALLVNSGLTPLSSSSS